MLAAAARITRVVDVPVTVDAEAGYGLEPAELVSELQRVGAAGCNLEETDHASESLREPEEQAVWLSRVREAADDAGYPLVINARIDVFLADGGPQGALVADALRRARAYLDAGADCVYPIALRERTRWRRSSPRRADRSTCSRCRAHRRGPSSPKSESRASAGAASCTSSCCGTSASFLLR